METRKQYTKEYKLDAVSLVLDQGLTLAEAAWSAVVVYLRVVPNIGLFVHKGAGKANGLRSVGVLWGFGDENELSGAGADVILVAPQELGELGGKFRSLTRSSGDI